MPETSETRTMDWKLSERMSRISASQTMAVAATATKLREQGLDVVDFGPGEPDFPTPDNIKEAAVRAIHDNYSKYTLVPGLKVLRQAIIEAHRRDFGSDFDLDEVMANVGAKHSIYNVVSALVDPGDEVLIPAPYWVTFADVTRYVGGVPVFVETFESDGFRLTTEMVEGALTPKTRLVIINSPSNPSGAVVDDEEFVRITELCRDRGVVVMSDECYCFFLYDGRKPFSIASRHDLKDNVVVVGSVSKTYAMTGWRLGWVLGDRRLIRGMNKLQSHMTSNPTAVAQMAAVEALTGPQDSVPRMLAEYARRRRYVVDRLNAIPGVECPEPGGAFYAYPNISAAFGREGIANSVDFAVRLLEDQQVAVVPGVAFGTEEHVRISYATSMEELEKGLDRLTSFM
jgi:aspartate aminotransferase